MVDGGEAPGCPKCLDEQLVTGSVAAAGQLLCPQGETQTSQGEAVKAAEGAGEQVDRQLRGELSAADPHVDNEEEGTRRMVVTQRLAADGRARGHLGECEGSGGRGNLRAGTHDDGHAIPWDAANQVVLAQYPRDRGPRATGCRRFDGEDRGDAFCGIPHSPGGALCTRGRGADALRHPRREAAQRGRLAVDRAEHEGRKLRQRQNGGQSA